MQKQAIPLEILDTELQENKPHTSKSILEGEIEGVQVEYLTVSNDNQISNTDRKDFRSIYLFLKGCGEVLAENTSYDIVPETIFLPNVVEAITITPAKDDTLHFLKISCELSAEDQIELQKLPAANTQNVYHAKFSDCQTYSEEIKSPNTVSRTILSNEYIPRVAMGTVQTMGPDAVAAHEHPMLEQLFLGLSKNDCIVYADDNQVNFPQYSILHIPLGSSHSVSVENDKTMYYVWMDFFLDKEGEEWLNTHNIDTDN